jgi:hypothetical protein
LANSTDCGAHNVGLISKSNLVNCPRMQCKQHLVASDHRYHTQNWLQARPNTAVGYIHGVVAIISASTAAEAINCFCQVAICLSTCFYMQCVDQAAVHSASSTNTSRYSSSTTSRSSSCTQQQQQQQATAAVQHTSGSAASMRFTSISSTRGRIRP